MKCAGCQAYMARGDEDRCWECGKYFCSECLCSQVCHRCDEEVARAEFKHSPMPEPGDYWPEGEHLCRIRIA